MSNSLEILETKVRTAVDELLSLRKENKRLKSECDMLKSQIALTGEGNKKAQRLLSDYDQMKRTHEQATARVERALEKLSSLSLQ